MKRVAPALPEALRQLEAAQLRRARLTVEGFAEPGNRALVRLGGRTFVDFSSNDYLGLARHPSLASAMRDCASAAGTGSGASHLVSGHGSEHALLEEELAAFTQREAALVFSTGYMANLAVLSSLAGRGERVLLDRLSHASLIDGALLSGATLRRYAHADAGAAARLASEHPARTVLIATDGVFSMDGDVAPLAALAAAAHAAQAWLVVDDAHGLGVVGAGGGGALALAGLSSEDAPVLIGTLGKAFGSFGAFVAGSADLIDFLVQKARPYIYTTALPQPVAAASRAALKVAQAEPWRRERLAALIERFRRQASAAHLPLADSHTPIQPLVLGSEAAVLAAQRALASSGFLVVAIRPPTVPKGSARLRVTLSAAHTDAQVDRLVAALPGACAHRDRAGAA
ncbi:MAG TPA: 8-amino-7-oxononanoate synthase [Steroidobacteraceae bacterium]|jgi:8-amino-7-oxononanoate synthase|nr:8-amino-7-oxononanoate synthase [Steroidobacteraceae bacterium]